MKRESTAAAGAPARIQRFGHNFHVGLPSLRIYTLYIELRDIDGDANKAAATIDAAS